MIMVANIRMTLLTEATTSRFELLYYPVENISSISMLT
jgi:hypothetical protein